MCVEWCIRQLSYPSTIVYNITSIAYNHHTDIYPLINYKLNIYILPQYKNVRPDYVKEIWKVVNWADVESNLKAAK